MSISHLREGWCDGKTYYCRHSIESRNPDIAPRSRHHRQMIWGQVRKFYQQQWVPYYYNTPSKLKGNNDEKNERKKDRTTSPPCIVWKRTGRHEDVVSDMGKFACFAEDAASTFDSLQSRHWHKMRTLWSAQTYLSTISFFDIPQISS